MYNPSDEQTGEFRCGIAAFVGRPNAGKSTLMNSVLGGKLAITSHKPQTTRHRIAGIHNDDARQMILLDTPGVHEASTELNKAMVDRAFRAVSEADVVCLVVDAVVLYYRWLKERPLWDSADRLVLQGLANTSIPVVVAFNKMDLIPLEGVERGAVDILKQALQEHLDIVSFVPLSAQYKTGLQDLVTALGARLPVSQPLYPQDQWGDVTERFVAAEFIREQILAETRQEIPYSACVEIERFDESERESKKLIKIFAAIIVEREQQKGIVIGKGGSMLKRIGSQARKEIQQFLGTKVYLKLFVKVEKDWARSKKGLKKVGYE